MEKATLQCTLCHLPFRKADAFRKRGDEVYEMKQDEGDDVNSFHVSCFSDTRQGRMGFRPNRRYFYGEEETSQLDLFTERFSRVV